MVITKMDIDGYTGIMNVLFENGNPVSAQLEKETKKSILGNIYIGKVKNIVANIQAAFIEIENGLPCYFPLAEQKHLIYTSGNRERGLRPGDEVLVQVEREAIKSKAPCVTACLGVTGKYLVLTTKKPGIGLSKKIQGEDRTKLSKWIEPLISGSSYGIVIRTNAVLADKEELTKEAMGLIQRYNQLCQIAPHRTCFSKLEEAPKSYLMSLRDAYMDQLDEIVVEDEQLYEEISQYLNAYQPEDVKKLRHYKDDLLALHKLYSMETVLSNLLCERVWLKSGGFLVIQQTEACVVIDVNSGKNSGKKKLEETFRRINLEAAAEIAVQLRLRNLSGIILVDFINMEEQRYNEELLDNLRKLFYKDPVQTKVIDMTPLHIVEITRKKIRKSFREQYEEIRNVENS